MEILVKERGKTNIFNYSRKSTKFSFRHHDHVTMPSMSFGKNTHNYKTLSYEFDYVDEEQYETSIHNLYKNSIAYVGFSNEFYQ